VTKKELAHLVMTRQALEVLRPLLPPGEYERETEALDKDIAEARKVLGL
jgi:hypothetical protein